jgi:transmembrane sensor
MPAETEDLWNEAMALLLEWQAAPDSVDAREAVRDFCALGPEHREAWEEVKRLYRLTGSATATGTTQEARQRKSAVSRRNVLAGLGVLALGPAIVKGPELWRRWQADAVTGTGATERIALPDGSVMTLGPYSAARFGFSTSARRVSLLEGMAFITVASDAARPFQAQAGRLTAITDATLSFEIRTDGDRSLVAMEDGRDLAVGIDTGAAQNAPLKRGEWLAIGAATSATAERGLCDVGQMAAWRDKRLIADQDRIGTVVAEIARWQTGEVVIPQRSLADARVSGLFHLGDPLAALAAVVAPYGGHVRQMTPWLTVLTTV